MPPKKYFVKYGVLVVSLVSLLPNIITSISIVITLINQSHVMSSSELSIPTHSISYALPSVLLYRNCIKVHNFSLLW